MLGLIKTRKHFNNYSLDQWDRDQLLVYLFPISYISKGAMITFNCHAKETRFVADVSLVREPFKSTSVRYSVSVQRECI